MAVRFDELEDLVDKIEGGRNIKRCSFGIEAGNFMEGRQKRWSVHSQGDVLEVVDSIVNYFFGNLLVFYERYSTRESAFELFGRNDSGVWAYSPIHSARAKRAVGLAHILGRYEQIPALVEKERAFLFEVNDFGLDGFEKFCRGLGF